jgi:chromosomal replication initiation ATPase DnaA
MIQHRQQATRLHPLSAEEIGVIVQQVTRAVLKVLEEREAEARAKASKRTSLRGPGKKPQKATPTSPRVVAIIEAACEVTGVKPADMIGPRKARHLAYPRQLAMLACAERANHVSLPQIGKAFNRDHTTILHGVSAARARVATMPDQRALYEAIMERVGA